VVFCVLAEFPDHVYRFVCQAVCFRLWLPVVPLDRFPLPRSLFLPLKHLESELVLLGEVDAGIHLGVHRLQAHVKTLSGHC
jgi:hypothetical protein